MNSLWVSSLSLCLASYFWVLMVSSIGLPMSLSCRSKSALKYSCCVMAVGLVGVAYSKVRSYKRIWHFNRSDNVHFHGLLLQDYIFVLLCDQIHAIPWQQSYWNTCCHLLTNNQKNWKQKISMSGDVQKVVIAYPLDTDMLLYSSKKWFENVPLTYNTGELKNVKHDWKYTSVRFFLGCQ